MLLELHVKNFALIDELSLEFGPGLNILTGETGAGKSIIIDALGLLLGGRASADAIRSGSESMYAEAVFAVHEGSPARAALADLGLGTDVDAGVDGGLLIISREVTNSGRNRCRINDRTVTVATLSSIGDYLVDIHGQHEHQSLLSPGRHIDLLDNFGGEELLALRARVASRFRDLRALEMELAGLLQDDRDKIQRVDLLQFQAGEIGDARLERGEEEELSRERLVLANAGKLFEQCSRAYVCLNGGDGNGGGAGAVDGFQGMPAMPARDLVALALSELRAASRIDSSLAGVVQLLEDATIGIEEAATRLRSYRDELEFNPERLAEIEDRLALIARLKRKYGDTVEAILDYKAKVEAELGAIERSGERIEELRSEIKALEADLAELCAELSAARVRAAKALEGGVMRELEELNMPGAVFKVDISQREAAGGIPATAGSSSGSSSSSGAGTSGPGREPGGRRLEVTERGVDFVEFLLSANPGEEPRPLARIASGGELSRIMLAIKAVLAAHDEIPTMVFDEIDSGVGGRAAQAVAEKLVKVSRLRQVICVTHLPQIASMADVHFHISKEVTSDRTRTRVHKLAWGDQVTEIARMLAGSNLTDITMKHAEEMISLATNLKKAM
ncbi:MAG: DNA repair protein RecN [Firmicutes bacterium]|nr:DNA repair protein RecN [Bacillota bacterium]